MSTEMTNFPDFAFDWLNEDETSLSVTYHGEIPTKFEYQGGFTEDGSDVEAVEVEDAGPN